MVDPARGSGLACRMRAFPSSLLAAGLLLAVSACNGNGDPVQEICELALSCDCSDPFADVNACVTELNEQVEQYKAQATANGLIYDDSCVDEVAARYTGSIECNAVAPASDACTFCSPVHGTQPAGAPCIQYDEFANCAQDLFCIDGVCLDPCNFIPVDGVCAVMANGETKGTGACAKGLYCDYAASLTCKPKIAQGQPCPNFATCEDGLACNGVTCEPIPGEGEPCTFSCEVDLVCDAGTCTRAPGAGEPCPNGVCDTESLCNGDTMFCVARQPLVCDIKEATEVNDTV